MVVFRSAEDFTIERRSYGKAFHPSGGRNVDNVGANWMSTPDNIKYGKSLQPFCGRNGDNEDARTLSPNISQGNWFLVVNNLNLSEIKYGNPSQYNYAPNVFNNGAMRPNSDSSQVKDNVADAARKVADNVADAAIKVGDKMNEIAWGRMKKVLKEQGYDVESMTKGQIERCWKSHLKGNGLTPQEEAEADAILNSGY